MADTSAIPTPTTPAATSGAAATTPEIKVTVEKGGLSADQAKQLTPVAKLNVGDKNVSLSQNSKETVDCAKGAISETASHKVTTTSAPSAMPESKEAQPEESPTPAPTSAPAPAPTPTYYSSAPSDSAVYSRNYLGLLGGYSYGPLPSYGATPVSFSEPLSQPAAKPISVKETPAKAPLFTHYLLHAYDVHSMGPGSTPSMVHIRGKNNEIIRSVKLEPGSSKIGVDLPPGDYTFEAVAGKRPDRVKTSDKCDNFGVDIYRDDKAAPAVKAPTTGKTPPPPSTKGAPSPAGDPLFAYS